MNRTILIVTIALIAMSCNNPKNNQKEKSKTEVINQNNTVEQMWGGIVSKAETTSYQYGTHQLNGTIIDGNPTTAGKVILFALKSDKIKLDDWIGKKVIVSGNKVVGYPIENGPDYIEVTAIENDQEVGINSLTNDLKTNLTKMKWSASVFSGFSDNNNPFGKDKPEIVFSADGKVSGKFCNSINGTYELLKDGKLKLNLTKTKMLCKGNLMLAENFLSSGDYDIDITKGYLNLVNSKGEIMSFIRATTSHENPMAN